MAKRGAVAVWSLAAAGRRRACVTVFDGARVIVGDGAAPIENASFIVMARVSRRSAARLI
jgi:hypothetical protein